MRQNRLCMQIPDNAGPTAAIKLFIVAEGFLPLGLSLLARFNMLIWMCRKHSLFTQNVHQAAPLHLVDMYAGHKLERLRRLIGGLKLPTLTSGLEL